MEKVTASISKADEDGMVLVVITQEGRDESFVLPYDQAHQWTSQEIAIRSALLNDEGRECEHGLSFALCNGPQHY